MKVERKGKKLVVSDKFGELVADVTGLTNNQVKQLGRKMQVDLIEGNTVYNTETDAELEAKEKEVVEESPVVEEVKAPVKPVKKAKKKVAKKKD